MQDNISHLKKVSSDQQKTVLQHPHGHQITIAHAHLSPEHKAKLDAMPHYAEGGVVDPMQAPDMLQPANPLAPDVVVPQSTDALDTSFDARRPVTMGEFKSPNQQLDDNEAKYKEMSGESAPPAAAPDDAKYKAALDAEKEKQAATSSAMPIPGKQNIIEEGLKGMESGINAQANAQGALGKQEAGIYNDQAAKIDKLQQDYNTNSKAIDNEIQATMDDIKNGHIDPDHYVNSKSALGQVSSAIGLLLGGIGGGLMHTENPALKFLNQQIDRDIDAQKANMQKKENLLSANYKQLGNMRDATAMTKSMYSEIYANKIASAAALSTDPMAQARAQQYIGELKLKYGPELEQMKQRKTVVDAVKSGNLEGDAAIPFVVNDKSKVGDVAKAYGTIKNLNQQQANIQGSFDHMKSQVLNGAFSPNDTESARQAFTGTIQHVAEGKYNYEAAQAIANSLLPQKTDTEDTLKNKQVRLDQFFEPFRQDHAATVKAFTNGMLPIPQYVRPQATEKPLGTTRKTFTK